MIVDNQEMRHLDPAQAITYVETYALPQSSLDTVLESYPQEYTRVRSARIWIVFARRFPEYVSYIIYFISYIFESCLVLLYGFKGIKRFPKFASISVPSSQLSALTLVYDSL